jgi:cytochrome d ubiquinol oxidase subunit II
MSPAPLVAGALAAVLVIYVLTGIADFGGGVWDMFAWGPNARRQRDAIAHAIGPIWEANHVWLIVALVVTFVCFPATFAAIGTALHVPLALFLAGVVLRGAAFVFRAYDVGTDAVQRRWSAIFAAGSAISPVLLGVVVGALASGRIQVRGGVVTGGWFAPWMQPFPWAVGALTLAISAFLAAVYLTLDTSDDRELQDLFRRRGLVAAGAVFVLAWTSFYLARTGAPAIWAGLWSSPWAIPFQLVVGLVGVGAIAALVLRRYYAARNLASLEAALVVAGWGLAQWPYTLPPDLTVHDAAPDGVLWGTLWVLGIGSPFLLGAYAWLMRVFGKALLSPPRS